MLNPALSPSRSPSPNSSAPSPAPAKPLVLRTAVPLKARAVLHALARLPHGRLHLTLPSGDVLHLGPEHGHPADLHLHHWRVVDEVLAHGDIGFGDSYLAGDWSSRDLTALLRHFLRNREHIEQLIYGTWWGGLVNRVRHWRNRNTKAGSSRNIQAHYDLGNAFYALWLDPGMTYSAACFDAEQAHDLEQAQVAKYRRALRSAGVQPGQHVLEVGCGWGGLAEQAVQHSGARVTGLTLSHEQLAWAQQRLRTAIDAGQVNLLLRDYREVHTPAHERFDAIVSIEMFEAVGREYWDGYFQMLARNLKAGGRACIQTITIRDELFDRYAASTDFIQRHVFPGGMLPSPSQFTQHAARAGLRVVDRYAFGPDYAATLRHWRERFTAQLDAVRAQGFDERFIRLWSFYLSYCEAGFDEGSIDVVQFTLEHAAP